MSATALILRKAKSADSTSNAFTAKIPTTTRPAYTSTGPVFWLLDPELGIAINTCIPRFVNVLPYGTDTNNETLNLRIWGWSRTGLAASPIYVPQLLAELQGTLSNGIDYTAVATGGFGCDTLTATSGGTDEKTLGVTIISPTGDAGQASALVHLRGCEYIEFDFKVGTAVSMNAHWRCMDQE